MRNKIFCLTIIFMFVLGIGIFILPQSETSKSEKRTLITNTDISSIDDVETLLKDQFYFRDTFNRFYYNFKIKLNNLVFDLIPAYKNQNYRYLSSNVIDLNDGYLCNDVLVYENEKLEIAKSRAFNINEMALKYPNIKTYVYFPTSAEEILYTYDNSNDAYIYKEEFIKQLNSNIKYSSLAVDSIEQYKTLFYKSDFHWNGYGAYQGYKDIINMIKEDFDIDGPKEIENIIVGDYLWTGNVASEIGAIGEKDNIIDLKLSDIGEYEYFVNGEDYEYGLEKKNYILNGNTGYNSDYDEYYGNNWYERRFEFNNDKPNILIFCDSLINVNQEWIASHFNTTILIDLRANDGSFNLDEYIEKYDIDIILVSQLYSNLFFNGYMFIPLN